jgi:antirestriction protein ArdC
MTLTLEERQARREADREFAAAAVERLLTSEGWQAWLAVRRHFHAYSLHNQLLIAMQRPDATRVAGFKAWLKLGYCVRKGEKALRIWAPMAPTAKALREWEAAGAAAAERPRTRFKLAPVFDRAQVDPLPPPAQPIALDPPLVDTHGDQLAYLLDGPLQHLADSIGVSFTLQDAQPGQSANGYFVPSAREIVVYKGRAANALVATAVHELAHAFRHIAHADVQLDYAAEELVVESVAYTVLGALGVDISGYAIPYLASWSAKADLAETIEQTAGLIDRIASSIEGPLLAGPAVAAA